MDETTRFQLAALRGVVLGLYSTARENPHLVVALTEVVHPELPVEHRLSMLEQMFHQVLPLFGNTAYTQEQIAAALLRPQPDAAHIFMLLYFAEMVAVLHSMSHTQILTFCQHAVPGDAQTAPAYLVPILNALRDFFQTRDQQRLHDLHSALSSTPLHMELRVLLDHEPSVLLELGQLLVDLLKLPLAELNALHVWFSAITPVRINYLAQLLRFDPHQLLQLKRQLSSGFPGQAPVQPPSTGHYGHQPSPPHHPQHPASPYHSSQPLSPHAPHSLDAAAAALLDPSSSAASSPSACSSSSSVTMPQQQLFGTTPPARADDFYESMTQPAGVLALDGAAPPSDSAFRLRLARQPPLKTVYQRILKPYPAVMLESGQDVGANLFVDVQLVRADTQEVMSCIEGTLTVRISNGIFAQFKKVKIMATSQMHGCLYKLRFQLKRFDGISHEILPGAMCESENIEVFSHTLYLNGTKSDGPSPPVVTEILPPAGTPGTRAVVLGGNFVHSPTLQVQIGPVCVAPTFHEVGTLIVTIPQLPPGTPGGPHPVTVSNDGAIFAHSNVYFVYM